MSFYGLLKEAWHNNPILQYVPILLTAVNPPVFLNLYMFLRTLDVVEDQEYVISISCLIGMIRTSRVSHLIKWRIIMANHASARYVLLQIRGPTIFKYSFYFTNLRLVIWDYHRIFERSTICS